MISEGKEACGVCGKVVATNGVFDKRRGPEGLVRCLEHIGTEVKVEGRALRVYYDEVVGAPQGSYLPRRRLARKAWCCSQAEKALQVDALEVSLRSDCCDEAEEWEVRFCPFCGAPVLFEKAGEVQAVVTQVPTTKVTQKVEYVPVPPDEGAEA